AGGGRTGNQRENREDSPRTSDGEDGCGISSRPRAKGRGAARRARLTDFPSRLRMSMRPPAANDSAGRSREPDLESGPSVFSQHGADHSAMVLNYRAHHHEAYPQPLAPGCHKGVENAVPKGWLNSRS